MVDSRYNRTAHMQHVLFMSRQTADCILSSAANTCMGHKTLKARDTTGVDLYNLLIAEERQKLAIQEYKEAANVGGVLDYGQKPDDFSQCSVLLYQRQRISV